MVSNQFISALLTLIFAGLLLLAYPVLHSNIPFLKKHFKSYQNIPLFNAGIEEIEKIAPDSLLYLDSLAMLKSLPGDSLEQSVYQSPSLVNLKDYSGTFALLNFLPQARGIHQYHFALVAVVDKQDRDVGARGGEDITGHGDYASQHFSIDQLLTDFLVDTRLCGDETGGHYNGCFTTRLQ